MAALKTPAVECDGPDARGPDCLPLGLFTPGIEALHDFEGTLDGLPVAIAVYRKEDWDALPGDARPPGSLSRRGDAVICFSRRPIG